jgi:hypothetical protein
MNVRARVTISSLALILILGLSSVGLAQKPGLAKSQRPFEPAEELFYEAEFSRSVLRNLDVAEFKFRSTRTHQAGVDSASQNAKPYILTFNADIISKGFFTRLFDLKFRERVESTVEPLTFTVLKSTLLDEQGKRTRHSETIFDRAKGSVSWTQRDPNDPTREPRINTTEFSGQLLDVLSAIYFIRTQPLLVGKSFDVFITDGGRVYQVPVNVVERKRIKTALGRVHAFRVEPQLFGPDKMIDHEKGQFSIWITDDERRLPIVARLKTDFGTFEVKLKRITTGTS